MDADFESLRSDVLHCRLCVETPIGPPLPHEPRPIIQGSTATRLVIASQAPGARAHASGVPFDDPSGRRLRTWLGVTPDVFYDPSRIGIVPMGFCFPGYDAAKGDLPPRPECAARWHRTVFDRLPEAELILMVGVHSMRYHLDRLGRWPRGLDRASARMSEIVASWRTILDDPRYPQLLPLPHPSWRNNVWLGRNPWFERELLPVLRAEVAKLTLASSLHSATVQRQQDDSS